MKKNIKRNIAIGLGAVMVAGMSITGISSTFANSTPKINTAQVQQVTKAQKTANEIQSATITEENAKEIMMNKVPGAEIMEFHLEKDDGILKYDGTLVKDNMEYDIDIDANTGRIISYEEDYYDEEDRLEDQARKQSNNINVQNQQTGDNQTKHNHQGKNNKVNNQTRTNYISREKAKQIMKTKTSGATLISLEFDYDDGRAVYEGELVKNNVEYDVTIDAITGTVLEFDKDYEEYDDDRYEYDDDDHDDDRYDHDEYDEWDD